jgi:Fur family transcriptional regulator, zinc uptake regulator
MAHHHGHDCKHPGLHVHNAKEFISAVEKACEARGLRLTPQRAQVLQIVADAGKPLKAYDLLERMKQLTGEPVAPPTAYRALDFLLEQGFIHKLASINAFVACHHPQEQHSVPFLICDNCQNAEELEDDKIASLLNQQAEHCGFEVRAQVLEVHGLCSNCRAK